MTEALNHLYFAIELCEEQRRAGRLFVFEHPASATSWGTNVIQLLAQKDGVDIIKFDFCQFAI